MTRRALVSLVVALAGAGVLTGGAVPALGGAAPGPVAVIVHLDEPALGPTNQDLVGLGWNTGSSLDPVAALEPRTVRIDARLESLSTGYDSDADLLVYDEAKVKDLLGRVAEVRRIGAEPQVILSYMPAWLGSPNAYGRDPTRMSPSDGDLWQRLIGEVVNLLATAESPATRFEVWNEPDLPIFFQDWPPAFLDLARRTHQAVADVEVEVGTDLQIGGPAAFFPDPLYIGAYVEEITGAGLPLDFVSWHWYGNTPFLGPDGAEDILPPYVLPLYPVIGQRNPITSPVAYAIQTDLVRDLVDGIVATRPGYDDIDLVIDEWNLSAGGYDLRHDTDEGAAFVLASLMEMEAAGLDSADLYRGIGSDTPGDWGIATATPDGTADGGGRKPSWYALDSWQRTAGARRVVSGAEPLAGIFARASTSSSPEVHHVLISSFVASGGSERSVRVDFDGIDCAAGAEIAVLRLDGKAASAPIIVDGSTVTFDLPAQTSRWIRAACEVA